MLRSYYATPWELRLRPWSLDITPDDQGNPPFLFDVIVDPYRRPLPMEWTTEDWDPALRFWDLPFDPQLTEWLKAVDPSRPSIMAARELAAQYSRWGENTGFLESNGWVEEGDLCWRRDAVATKACPSVGFNFIQAEIGQLQQLMQDDRDRYLAEIEAQADGIPEYVIAFVGASQERHPWTIELVNCGLAMGNVAYMRWKSLYKRVRPSFLCPSLAPAFGPPGHPSFPSGHSTLAHLLALFLLEIPGVRERFGYFKDASGAPGQPIKKDMLAGTKPINSPLLWLAARLAKNRERLGVHYPSDSSAGRHLAAAMRHALFHESDGNKAIHCPTLKKVLAHARAEWPEVP